MSKDSTVRTLVVAATGWLLAGNLALAQHADILIWDEDGKVGVGEYDYENGIPSGSRVHLSRFDDLYTIDSPGFTSFSGGDALPGGNALTWDFLPMTVDAGVHAGYRSTVLYWNGQGATPNFGPTITDDYEFSIYSVVGSASATGQSEVETGSVIAITPPNGAIHEHPFYFLDDNGDGLSATPPAAGIYVTSLRLAIGDLEPSAPVFFVWATPESSVLPAIQPAALWVNERIDTLVVEQLDGDFNGDGLVDAADYTVWRDGLGTFYQQSDYAVWASNYGSSAALATSSAAATPEPTSIVLLISAVSAVWMRSCSVSFSCRRTPCAPTPFPLAPQPEKN
jgi:hypothetical protein